MAAIDHWGGGRDVLIAVDLQNDFFPGGALAVAGADRILPIINRLARRFRHVVLTQDWHPRGHTSFASSHPGRMPLDSITLSYGAQILWPDHCRQDSPGAAFVEGLDIPHAELILRKGCDPGIDSYSAFFENDRKTSTGLTGYLKERGVKRIMLAGLAFDFCVRYSAEDAKKCGFDVVVAEDACGAIDIADSAAQTRRLFGSLSIGLISAADVGAGS